MTCEEFRDYFVGVALGDGDLTHDRRGYRVRIVDASREYLETLSSQLEGCFGAKGKIYKVKTFSAYYLVVWRKDLYMLIKNNVERLLQSPTPAFVAGLIDAEAGVGRTDDGLYRLYFTNIRKAVIDAVAKVLDRYGIKYYLVNEKRRHRLYVHGIDRIKALLDIIPAMHPKVRGRFLSLINR